MKPSILVATTLLATICLVPAALSADSQPSRHSLITKQGVISGVQKTKTPSFTPNGKPAQVTSFAFAFPDFGKQGNLLGIFW